MKIRYLIIILLLPIIGFSQTCDSVLYKQLINFSNSKTITENDFNKCCIITEKLLKENCNDYIKELKGEYYRITTLTYTFGEICIKAKSLSSVKAYINYYLEKKGSPEEQLDFSLERVFVKRPSDFMKEYSTKDTSTKKRMVYGLAWGFLNNRCYGAIDPHEDNPNKAMTFYDNPPKVVLDTTNYKTIYFSLNPEIGEIYTLFKKDMDEVLSIIIEAVRFEAKRKKND